MNIYLLLIISLVLLLFCGNSFYVVFKKYEEDDDFAYGFNTLSIIKFLFGILLFISKIFFPERLHIIIRNVSRIIDIFKKRDSHIKHLELAPVEPESFYLMSMNGSDFIQLKYNNQHKSQ